MIMDIFKGSPRLLISVLLVLVLIFSSISFAFADDENGADVAGDSSPASSDVVTIPQGVYLDQDVYELDNNLRSLASTLSASSPYTADDIYQLLLSVISSNQFKVVDNQLRDAVRAIYLDLYSDGTATGTPIGEAIDNLNNTLSDFYYYNNLNTTSINNLLWDICFGLGLNDFDSSTDVSFSTLLTLIYGRIDTINSLLTGANGISSIDNRLNSVNTNLSNIISINTSTYSLLSQFKDAVGSLLGGIDSTLDDIHEYTSQSMFSLSHIDSDFHDLKQWLVDTFYYSFTSTNINYIEYCLSNPYSSKPFTPYPLSFTFGDFPDVPLLNNVFETSTSLDYDVYIKLDGIWDVPSNYRPIFSCFVYTNDFSSKNIGYSGTANISFDGHGTDTLIIHYSFSNIDSNYKYFAPYFNGYTGSFITFTPNDTYNVQPYIPVVVNLNGNYIEHIDSDLHSQLDILNRFKDLYASDDLVQAKEEQQNFEDAALEDFTGEGSAAASLGDLGSAKDISGALKYGLNAGGSVGTALGVFNSSSSFWGWFSQENYNNINSLYNPTPTRNSKGGSSDLDVLGLPYDYDELLQYYLDGGQ